jgi:GNAT superfamily N-acetyltransferase
MEIFTEELVLTESALASCAAAMVATTDDQIVGFFVLKAHEGSCLELDFLFVDPNHLHQGIGTLLFETAAAMARDQGMTQLMLISDPNAVEFYQRLGAVVVGEHQSSIADRRIPIMVIDLIPGR